MPFLTPPLILWSLAYVSLASNWLRLLNTEECERITQDPEEAVLFQENKLAPHSWLGSTKRNKRE